MINSQMLYRFASLFAPTPGTSPRLLFFHPLFLILTFRANFEKKFYFVGTCCTKLLFSKHSIQSNRESSIVEKMALHPQGNSINLRFNLKHPRAKQNCYKKKYIEGCHLLAPRSRRKFLLIDCFPSQSRREKNLTCHTKRSSRKQKGELLPPFQDERFAGRNLKITRKSSQNRFNQKNSYLHFSVCVCLHMCKTTTTTTICFCFVFVCVIIFSIGFVQGLLCFFLCFVSCTLNTDNETKRF